jgi:hypothetical protein
VASAWVCVVQAVVTAGGFGGLDGAGAGAGVGSLDEPLTEPHQRESRLPLDGSLAGSPADVVLHELGFAASE